MTYLEAAHQILQRAGRPLHYKTITEQALAEGLISPSGLRPDATMGSRLYTETKHEGSQFIRAGKGIFGLSDWRPKGIDRQVQHINQQVRDELQVLLHTVPAERFEALVGELLIQMGFDENTVTVTKRSGDGGIDVKGTFRAAGLAEVQAAVQVKRWKGSVGAKIVRELRGSLETNEHGIIITTSWFTQSAQVEAAALSKKQINLIDGHALLELLMRYRIGVIEKTLTVVSLDDDWWGEVLNLSPADEEDEPATTAEGDGGVTKSMGPSSSVTGKKPVGLVLFGEEYPADSWKRVLVRVCSVLAARHGSRFVDQAPTVKGKKRQYIAANPDKMNQPVPIPGTELYVETNESAERILAIVHRLLGRLGDSSDALTVKIQDTEFR